MPIVRIDIQAGKSTAYKRSVLHGVRRALLFTLGVEDERIMQRIIESPPENIDAGAVRTDGLTIIEVAMLAGHASDIKFHLYESIVRELRFAPGIVASDVVVHVIDAPASSFCVGGEPLTEPGEAKPDKDAEPPGEDSEEPPASPAGSAGNDASAPEADSEEPLEEPR